MTPANVALMEKELRQEWSPKQVAGWLKEERRIRINLETIYLYVWANKRQGGDLYTHLRHQVKGYRSRKGPHSSRGKIKIRVSIHDRPSEADAKERIGDWEIDLILGKGHSSAMVTIVERALDAQTYFADQYSLWQRGLSENTSGLLRQYWPKKTDFKQVAANDVVVVLEKLNNRPRKTLNYQTPVKVMRESSLKTAT